ncbi:MAG: hypothetical protein LBV58_00450 [Acholeplasmatales bacterium]|jgi:ABC-2 type transport system permease protein|nr:hypothetical protein [Acholeplasmatales bacterium]
MKKFKFLFLHGLKKRIKTKAFLLSNIFIGIVMLIITILPGFISSLISDDEQDNFEILVYNATIIPDTDINTAILSIMANNSYDATISYGYIDSSDPDFENVGDLGVILRAIGGTVNTLTVELVINSADPAIHTKYASIFGALRLYVAVAGYQLVNTPVTVISNSNLTYESEDEVGFDMLLSLAFCLPVFMLVIMGVSLLGTEIVDEKSTKAIETIISSVKPSTHYYSKILSVSCFVLIETIIMLVIGAFGSLISGLLFPSTGAGGDVVGSFLQASVPHILLGILFLVLFTAVGVLGEFTIASLFASMSNSNEDYQHVIAPFMVANLLIFYVVIFGSMFDLYGTLKFLVYIPFLSMMTVPFGLASGVLTILESFISLLIFIVAVYGINRFVGPIYRIAILTFDESKTSKRFLFYIKKAFHKDSKKIK